MNDCFIRKDVSEHDTSVHKVSVLLGLRKEKAGDIGLEIEVEGNQFPKSEDHYDEEDNYHNGKNELIPDQWDYVHDGSLRGQDNAEYVLSEPIKFDEVPKALSDLWNMFEEYGSVLDESNRTSVHVHLNATDFHLNRVCAFVALYVSVEELLTAWCGDHRVGNLFCLRAKDAPAILTKARNFFCTGDTRHLDDGLHYSGLNLHSITKHGSIEVRAMRGVRDPEVIQTWVNILQRIYELSAQFEDPRGICESYSGGGAERYLSNVLGPNAQRVIDECGLSYSQAVDSVRRGIRLAQKLCYARDWSAFKPSNVQPDPFGRKAGRVGLIESIMSTPSMTTFAQHTSAYMMLDELATVATAWPTSGD